MNKEHSGYRHRKHDQIVSRIERGLTDTAVAAELKCDRRAVARVRAMLGLPPMTNATTKGDKLDRFSSEPDAYGHIAWNGRVTNSGTPVIRHLGKEVPAAAVAFERRAGRPPVGMSRADCDQPQCLAPDHVLDDIERRRVRLQNRQLEGLDAPWAECPKAGHPWEEFGRVEPDLTLYCSRCNTERASRTRAARNEEGTV